MRLPIVTRHGGSVAKALHSDLSCHCERSEAIHMTSRRSQLQEDTYFRVLRMLQDNPDMTQREIAEKLGVSTSGLNYCLKALIDKGWVKVHNFSQSKNKFGYIYVLNRCFDQRVPEETNRRIVDHTADINLTYSTIARD